jgi:hypothetical protein
MITYSRTCAVRILVTRHFEFDRFQKQSLASAYETLIPVTSTHPARRPKRAGNFERSTTRSRDLLSFAAGA